MNGLYRFDMDGFRAVNLGLHAGWLDPFFAALSYSGLGEVPFALSLLFLISRETRGFVLPLLVSILVSGLVVAGAFKNFLDRDRPSNLAFAMPQEPIYHGSFPSGHTTTSFAVATMLVLLTRHTKRAWYGWAALVWAALVGFSRIYRGVHWPTDVIAGVFAGVFSACLVSLFFDLR